VPELQRLHAGRAAAVLAFGLANRSYFAAFASDRGDEFFGQALCRSVDQAGICLAGPVRDVGHNDLRLEYQKLAARERRAGHVPFVSLPAGGERRG